MPTTESAEPAPSNDGRESRVARSLHHSLRDGVFYSAMIGSAESYFTAFAVLLKAGAPADQMSDKGELPVDLTPNANTKKLINSAKE